MLRSNQLSYIAESRHYRPKFKPLSTVLPGRSALVDEGVHAFLLVLGGEEGVEHAALEHHAVGQAALEGAVHRLLGRHHRQLRELADHQRGAEEAERAGLVSRVVAADKLQDEALGAALSICDFSQMATMATKEAVNKAFETSLSDGLGFERRLFHALFATEDQKEGMDAFVNKRKAEFKHR